MQASPTHLAPEPDALQDASVAARLGSVVGNRWRLDRVLGVGAAAAVYAATHHNGSRVAIKILHAELVQDHEHVDRFTSEGQIGNRVDHPGVVRTLDDGHTDDGIPFSVMELLEGETLAARVQRGPLEAIQAARLFVDVLDALAAAHDRGLVHRDVKPDNVFLPRGGGIKLLDFGIARAADLSPHHGTLQLAVLGTPAYMAPEQARALWHLVDAQSDVWALGATLFFALTGRAVHRGDSVVEELLSAAQPVVAVAALAPAVPAPLAVVLDRALAYDRSARYASARAMQAELRAFCTHSTARAASISHRPRRRRPTPWVLASLAVTALALWRLAPTEPRLSPQAARWLTRGQRAPLPIAAPPEPPAPAPAVAPVRSARRTWPPAAAARETSPKQVADPMSSRF